MAIDYTHYSKLVVTAIDEADFLRKNKVPVERLVKGVGIIMPYEDTQSQEKAMREARRQAIYNALSPEEKMKIDERNKLLAKAEEKLKPLRDKFKAIDDYIAEHGTLIVDKDGPTPYIKMF